jgi:hypothetical protein
MLDCLIALCFANCRVEYDVIMTINDEQVTIWKWSWPT